MEFIVPKVTKAMLSRIGMAQNIHHSSIVCSSLILKLNPVYTSFMSTMFTPQVDSWDFVQCILRYNDHVVNTINAILNEYGKRYIVFCRGCVNGSLRIDIVKPCNFLDYMQVLYKHIHHTWPQKKYVEYVKLMDYLYSRISNRAHDGTHTIFMMKNKNTGFVACLAVKYQSFYSTCI